MKFGHDLEFDLADLFTLDKKQIEETMKPVESIVDKTIDSVESKVSKSSKKISSEIADAIEQAANSSITANANINLKINYDKIKDQLHDLYKQLYSAKSEGTDVEVLNIANAINAATERLKYFEEQLKAANIEYQKFAKPKNPANIDPNKSKKTSEKKQATQSQSNTQTQSVIPGVLTDTAPIEKQTAAIETLGNTAERTSQKVQAVFDAIEKLKVSRAIDEYNKIIIGAYGGKKKYQTFGKDQYPLNDDLQFLSNGYNFQKMQQMMEQLSRTEGLSNESQNAISEWLDKYSKFGEGYRPNFYIGDELKSIAQFKEALQELSDLRIISDTSLDYIDEFNDRLYELRSQIIGSGEDSQVAAKQLEKAFKDQFDIVEALLKVQNTASEISIGENVFQTDKKSIQTQKQKLYDILSIYEQMGNDPIKNLKDFAWVLNWNDNGYGKNSNNLYRSNVFEDIRSQYDSNFETLKMYIESSLEDFNIPQELMEKISSGLIWLNHTDIDGIKHTLDGVMSDIVNGIQGSYEKSFKEYVASFNDNEVISAKLIEKSNELSKAILENGMSLEEASNQFHQYRESILSSVDALDELAKPRKTNSKIVKVRELTQEQYDAIQERYESSHDGNVEELENVVDIIQRADEYGTHFAADIMTDCKTARGAIERLFSAIDPEKYPQLAEFKETFLETIQSPLFKQQMHITPGTFSYSDQEKYKGFTLPGTTYSFGIDFPDADSAYAYLNVLDVAADKSQVLSDSIEQTKREIDESLEQQDRYVGQIELYVVSLKELRENIQKVKHNNDDDISYYKSYLYFLDKEKERLESVNGLLSKIQSLKYKHFNIQDANNILAPIKNAKNGFNYSDIDTNRHKYNVYQQLLQNAQDEAAAAETARKAEEEATNAANAALQEKLNLLKQISAQYGVSGSSKLNFVTLKKLETQSNLGIVDTATKNHYQSVKRQANDALLAFEDLYDQIEITVESTTDNVVRLRADYNSIGDLANITFSDDSASLLTMTDQGLVKKKITDVNFIKSSKKSKIGLGELSKYDFSNTGNVLQYLKDNGIIKVSNSGTLSANSLKYLASFIDKTARQSDMISDALVNRNGNISYQIQGKTYDADKASELGEQLQSVVGQCVKIFENLDGSAQDLGDSTKDLYYTFHTQAQLQASRKQLGSIFENMPKSIQSRDDVAKIFDAYSKAQLTKLQIIDKEHTSQEDQNNIRSYNAEVGTKFAEAISKIIGPITDEENRTAISDAFTHALTSMSTDREQLEHSIDNVYTILSGSANKIESIESARAEEEASTETTSAQGRQKVGRLSPSNQMLLDRAGFSKLMEAYQIPSSVANDIGSQILKGMYHEYQTHGTMNQYDAELSDNLLLDTFKKYAIIPVDNKGLLDWENIYKPFLEIIQGRKVRWNDSDIDAYDNEFPDEWSAIRQRLGGANSPLRLIKNSKAGADALSFDELIKMLLPEDSDIRNGNFYNQAKYILDTYDKAIKSKKEYANLDPEFAKEFIKLSDLTDAQKDSFSAQIKQIDLEFSTFLANIMTSAGLRRTPQAKANTEKEYNKEKSTGTPIGGALDIGKALGIISNSKKPSVPATVFNGINSQKDLDSAFLKIKESVQEQSWQLVDSSINNMLGSNGSGILKFKNDAGDMLYTQIWEQSEDALELVGERIRSKYEIDNFNAEKAQEKARSDYEAVAVLTSGWGDTMPSAIQQQLDKVKDGIVTIISDDTEDIWRYGLAIANQSIRTEIQSRKINGTPYTTEQKHDEQEKARNDLDNLKADVKKFDDIVPTEISNVIQELENSINSIISTSQSKKWHNKLQNAKTIINTQRKINTSDRAIGNTIANRQSVMANGQNAIDTLKNNSYVYREIDGYTELVDVIGNAKTALDKYNAAEKEFKEQGTTDQRKNELQTIMEESAKEYEKAITAAKSKLTTVRSSKKTSDIISLISGGTDTVANLEKQLEPFKDSGTKAYDEATKSIEAMKVALTNFNGNNSTVTVEQQIQAVDDFTAANEKCTESLKLLQDQANLSNSFYDFVNGLHDIKNIGLLPDSVENQIDALEEKVGTVSADDKDQVQQLSEELGAIKQTVSSTMSSFDIKDQARSVKEEYQGIKKSLEDTFNPIKSGNIFEGTQEFDNLNNAEQQLIVNIDELLNGTGGITDEMMNQLPIIKNTSDALKDQANAYNDLSNAAKQNASFGSSQASQDFYNQIQSFESVNALQKYQNSNGQNKNSKYYIQNIDDLLSYTQSWNQQYNASELKTPTDYYNRLMNLQKSYNSISKKLNDEMLDNLNGNNDAIIANLQKRKSQIDSEISSIQQSLQRIYQNGYINGNVYEIPGFENTNIGTFFNDVRVQAELTTEQIEKFISACEDANGIKLDLNRIISNYVSQYNQYGSIINKYLNEGTLSVVSPKMSDVQKYEDNILDIIKRNTNSTSNTLNPFTEWSSQDLSNFINNVNQYKSAIKSVSNVVEKESSYFSGKTIFTGGTETLNKMTQQAQNTSTSFDGVKQRLITDANEIAKALNGDAIINNFVASANGISRLDFSVFDKTTMSLRTFSLELGQATDNVYGAETSVKNANPVLKEAQNQLNSILRLIEQLKGYGQDTTGLENIADQLSKGLSVNADSNVDLSSLSTQAKILSSAAKKKLNQQLKFSSSVENGDISLSGISIDTNANAVDTYNQMSQAILQYFSTVESGTVAIGKFNEVNKTIPVTFTTADGTVKTFTASMGALTGQVGLQETGVGKVTSEWGKLSTVLRSSLKQISRYVIGFSAWYKIIAGIRQGVTYVKEIDSAMTELKKVTNATKEEYNSFLDGVADKAATVGATMTEFIEATSDFARLGYSISEASELSEVANVYANVGDEVDSIDDASSSIISTMKAFGIEASDAMSIVDKFNEVGKILPLDNYIG